jgi:RHS repeat-associated protein
MKTTKKTGALFYKFVAVLLLSTFIFSPVSASFADVAPTDSATQSPATQNISPVVNIPVQSETADTSSAVPKPAVIISKDSSSLIATTPEQLAIKNAAGTSSLLAAQDPSTVTDAANKQISSSTAAKAAISPMTAGVTPSQMTDAPQLSVASKAKLTPEVDNTSGALRYSYPITIPPGRNNLTPDISLQYNSQNTSNDSVVGYGWSLSIPYIEREGKHGVDNLYTGTYNDFTTSDHGELGQVSGGNYQLKSDDGSFDKYVFASNKWTVTTKAGTIYTYGSTALSQQNDSAAIANVYKWMLDSITDSNGNSISYTYFKDQGQIYPDTITYTNTTGGSGPFSVTFGREAQSFVSASNYTTGFPVTTQYHINSITAKISSTTRHSYALAYTTSDNASRSLLSTITETGFDVGGSGTTLAPTKFSYSHTGTAPFTLSTLAMPSHTLSDGSKKDSRLENDNEFSGYPGNKTGTLIDVNGDGLPDWIESEDPNFATISADNALFYGVWLGTLTGFVRSTSWSNALPKSSAGATYQLSPYGNNKVADVNGDGLPDIIIATPGTTINSDTDVVWLNNGAGWTKTASWTMPTMTVLGTTYGVAIGTQYNPIATAPTGYNYYTNVIDINNDGLPDLVQTTNDNFGALTTSDHYGVWLNTGTGWTRNTAWSAAMPIHLTSGTYYGSIVTGQGTDTITDLNGDGLPDWIETTYQNAPSDNYDVWLNNGAGWTKSTAWTSGLPIHTAALPAYTATPSGATLGISQITCNVGIGNSYACGLRSNALADVNGDGLPDFVETSDSGVANYEYQTVWLNNGKNGWARNTTWSLPQYMDYSGGQPKPIRLGNDGLYSTQLSDINNDGLLDYVVSCDCGTTGNAYTPQQSRIFINNGMGWVGNGAVEPKRTDNGNYNGSVLGVTDYVQYPYVPIHRTTELQDINNDGSPDWIETTNIGFAAGTTQAPGFERQAIWTNPAAQPSDLLTAITYDHGASSSVAYAPQVIVDKNATNQTQTVEAVTSIATTPTNWSGAYPPDTSTTTYSYANGKYFYSTNKTWRKFAGFQKVTTTNPDGSKIINYYHQGNGIDTATYEYSDAESEIGKLYRTDITDASGNLYKRTTTEWGRSAVASVNSDVNFVYPYQIITEDFDGNATERATAVVHGYNITTGNPSSDTYYGEVTATSPIAYTDIGTDKKLVTYAYATNASGMYAVSDEHTFDQSSNTVKEVSNTYDGLAYGSLSLGNKTDVANRKDSATFVATHVTYNSYGLPLTSTDERGKVTTYTYDANNLYPATATDAAGHTTSYTYDYMLGKVLQTTDQNGKLWTKSYDGLGRITGEQIPDPATGSSVYRTQYSYTDQSTGISYWAKSDKTDGSISADDYHYTDGLGRTIEERKQTDPNGVWSNYQTTNTMYDNMGRVAKQSIPYNSYGPLFYPGDVPTTASLYTTYSYDPEGRVSSVANAVGTTTNAYDQWKTTTTDPNGNVKKYYADAYGNLAQVDEINGASTYTTTHAWNTNNDLIKITDALGNVRNFTYDMIDRRLTAEDLHAAADTTFGVWTYAYDAAGNITQSISPKAATVNYTYDNINRKLTEDYTGAAGTEITYAYDSCTQGIGKLCSVTMTSGANTAYTYDADGNVASESKTINASSYTTAYAYNRAGNIVTIKYPDNAIVQYNYLSDGLVSSVQQEEAGGTLANVINGITYSPDLKISYMHNVTGNSTTNTYDPAQMYRLTHVVTLDGTPSHIQDLTYTYDADSNITNLVDASIQDSSKTVAYTYDALNRIKTASATGVGPGTSPYSETYTYDALGNLTAKNGQTYLYQGNTGTLTANPDAATSMNAITQTYDADGNLTANGTLTNTWNYKDQLTQTVKGATTVTYMYDENGNRILYKVGTVTTATPNKYYSYDGTTKTKQIYFGNTLIATIKTAGGVVTPWYVNTDNINGTSLATSSTGAVKQALDYYPFGDIRMNETWSTIDDKNKFGGHPYDADTDLNYLGARYYNAKIGRFISEDPTATFSPETLLQNPQALNTYSYANNNPLTNIDPDGKFAQSLFNSYVNSLPQYSSAQVKFFGPSNLSYFYRQTGDPVNTGRVNTDKLQQLGSMATNAALLIAGGGEASIAESALSAETASTGIKTYQVYEKLNQETGQVYVGRTSGTSSPEANVQNRDFGHHMTSKGFGAADLKYSSTSADAIRGQEQRGINQYKSLGISGNAINGISATNPNLNTYIGAALKAFGVKW